MIGTTRDRGKRQDACGTKCGGHTVAATLVAERHPPPDSALFEYLCRRLAPDKRPRHVCYVDQLPLALTGKLDRRALPETARELRSLSRHYAVQA
jgi:acyl-CoA synthetase (AMP-forming)/AMP-acid ligase II